MPERLCLSGAAILGAGLSCFLLIHILWPGGLGPCEVPGQLELLLFGIGLTGIGGALTLITSPIVVVRKLKARRAAGTNLKLFG